MAKGFVAGFIKRDGTWIGQWGEWDTGSVTRASTLEVAKAEIAQQLAIYCGGTAVARRKVVFIDALCPDGRELLERIFEAVRREQPETDST